MYKKLNMRKKFSQIISVIINIYIFILILNLFQKKLFLHPLYTSLIQIEKYNFIKEICFFEDYTLQYKPFDENEMIDENILFYFNGNAGNCSTRFTIIRQLQKIFPKYTIVQTEYPGFGQLYHLPLDIDDIYDYSKRIVLEYLKKTKNHRKNYIFFGEGFGGYIQANTYVELSKLENVELPTQIFQYNTPPSLDVMFSKNLPWFLQALSIPSMTLSYLFQIYQNVKKVPNFYLWETNDFNTIYFDMKTKFDNVYYLDLKGSEKFGILIEENFEKIKKSIQNEQHFIYIF